MSQERQLQVVWSGSARQGLEHLSIDDRAHIARMIHDLTTSPVITSSQAGDVLRLTVTPHSVTRGRLRPDGLFCTEISVLPDLERGLLRVRDVEQLPTVQHSPTQPVRIARSTTELAVRLAGAQRSYLDNDWAAVLAGSPEDGIQHSQRRQLGLALGFITAALRMRLGDLARPIWRPIDWLLRVQSRTNAFITAVVGGQAVYIVDDGGLAALVTEVWEPCGGAGLALYALARWLRRLRGIELAEARRHSNDA